MRPQSSYAPMTSCSVIELRQYTAHAGARDRLVRLFEENLIEGQEDHGIRVLGQFRDLSHPDRFVWMRGFLDIEARTRALERFYAGPVWKAHRKVAKAVVAASDNVLLLKPAGEHGELWFDPAARPRGDPAGPPRAVIAATLYYFADPIGAAFTSWFRREIVPVLASLGTSVLAELVTEPAPNLFPRLPVREGENVFVWLAAHADAQCQAASTRRLEALPRWRDGLAVFLRAKMKRDPETLLLSPTPRSLLPHR